MCLICEKDSEITQWRSEEVEEDYSIIRLAVLLNNTVCRSGRALTIEYAPRAAPDLHMYLWVYHYKNQLKLTRIFLRKVPICIVLS